MAILMKDKVLFGLSAQEAVFVIEYNIIECVRNIVADLIPEIGIDAEWLLYELVDNHRIARQHGNISASNTALGTIAKHVHVDALAKQRIEIDDVSDRELLQRLQDGRKRMNKNDDEVSFI
jgi:hypothetical protein